MTIGPGLVGEVGKDEIYTAMDWLLERQTTIENTLARRHLQPGGMAMFDVSSSWVEGSKCELADFGYSRDHKKGKKQIVYGLLTCPQGRPVGVRVFPGNTADPDTFVEIVDVVRDQFKLKDLVMVGDRGMITKARIEALQKLNEELRETTTQKTRRRRPRGLSWITCLHAPEIKKLAIGDRPLQMSLFDTQDLAEISHPDYPDERLVACRNPILADERARKRADLLAATEKLLNPIIKRVEKGRLKGPTSASKSAT